MNQWKKTLTIPILLLFIFLLAGCNESYRELPVDFEYAGNSVSGSLVLPRACSESITG